MDGKHRKTALRMIPYGLYVLTGKTAAGEHAAATVNWVTQCSFHPPLLAVGVKADSGAHQVIKTARALALNILGKGQGEIADAYFRPLQVEPGKLSGHAFEDGPATGAPVRNAVPAYVECRLVDTVERGDRSVFAGEVVDAMVRQEPSGRADAATLWLRDLGEKVFYGG
jgi:flavin reductase (DIM6/NTAB) family NADH-FMN oxidoreductase RutF